MVEIIFKYKEYNIIIKANLNDSFESIINKFLNLTKLNINNLQFLSDDEILNQKDIISNKMYESEKLNKKIIILVNTINELINNGNTNIIISKDIICPICKEQCTYSIKDFKIKLDNCKNEHIIENIKLNDFLETQKIDISKINCDKCPNKKKSNTLNNEFYICNDCKMNLCPLCKEEHDKSHLIINYDDRNYICLKHNELFGFYCEDCKMDLCTSCLNMHKNHKLKSFEDLSKGIMFKDVLGLEHYIMKKIKQFKIEKFKEDIEVMINKLVKVKESIELYYNINNNIMNYYENLKKRNYKTYKNMKKAAESLYEEIERKKIFDISKNLSVALYIFNEIFDENKEIELTYEIPKETNLIKIFGSKFVDNNLNKCQIIYQNITII